MGKISIQHFVLYLCLHHQGFMWRVTQEHNCVYTRGRSILAPIHTGAELKLGGRHVVGGYRNVSFVWLDKNMCL